MDGASIGTFEFFAPDALFFGVLSRPSAAVPASAGLRECVFDRLFTGCCRGGGVPLSEASSLWGQCEGRRDPEESWTCKVRICYWNDKSTSWRFTKSSPSQKNNSPVDRRECGRVSREEKVSKKIRRSFFFLQPISVKLNSQRQR